MSQNANTNKSTTYGERGGGGITVAELWSSAYLPWIVSEQPWLNDNIV